MVELTFSFTVSQDSYIGSIPTGKVETFSKHQNDDY